MSNFYLTLLIIAAACGVAALIALPFVYRRGMKQIDEATSQIFDKAESVSNVRRLRADELHRRMMRKDRTL